MYSHLWDRVDLKLKVESSVELVQMRVGDDLQTVAGVFWRFQTLLNFQDQFLKRKLGMNIHTSIAIHTHA